MILYAIASAITGKYCSVAFEGDLHRSTTHTDRLKSQEQLIKQNKQNTLGEYCSQLLTTD